MYFTLFGSPLKLMFIFFLFFLFQIYSMHSFLISFRIAYLSRTIFYLNILPDNSKSFFPILYENYPELAILRGEKLIIKT